MKEANKKRILWIDYAKAFAMFFVVIGHVNSGNYLTNWICTSQHILDTKL